MIFGGTTLKTGNIMNNHVCLVLFFFLILSLLPASVLSEQIIIDSDDQFQFAQQYMKREKYQQAIGEFERFIYFFPKDEKAPEVHYLIGECYLRGKEYESARKVLISVYRRYAGRPIAGKALFLIGESYYRQDVSDEADRYFKKVIADYPYSELKNAALYRLGWSRMQAERWHEASDTFHRVGKKSPLYAGSLDLSEKSLEGEQLPYKGPTAAGVLAGIVPGLGHVYCNRYKDGMVAFLLNGLFIWAAVESFEQGHEVLGGIISFVELGWYTGNIYSAVNCAHKHNRKVRDDFRRSLPDNLNLNLFSNGDGHLGLALKFDF